uniref:Lipocalin/cytosolic fatty-acid binding domain-containing protein n=1 Tax=Loxodonta africana TaxID=9785 RepID=G3UBJ8_LOXAF
CRAESLSLCLGLSLYAGFVLTEPWITGIWYVKAMVANKNLPLEKRPKKVSPLTVTALEGGDLEASFTFLKKDQCHEKGIVMERVGDPGKYIAKGGKKHIYLQELPVKDHYIILGECQHDERTFHMGKLLGEWLQTPRAPVPLAPPSLPQEPTAQLQPLWKPWKNLGNSLSEKGSSKKT